MAECDEDEEGIKKRQRRNTEGKNRPTFICHSTETRQDSCAPRTRAHRWQATAHKDSGLMGRHGWDRAGPGDTKGS